MTIENETKQIQFKYIPEEIHQEGSIKLGSLQISYLTDTIPPIIQITNNKSEVVQYSASMFEEIANYIKRENRGDPISAIDVSVVSILPATDAIDFPDVESFSNKPNIDNTPDNNDLNDILTDENLKVDVDTPDVPVINRPVIRSDPNADPIEELKKSAINRENTGQNTIKRT